jgi:hypothetical protein
MCDHGGTAGIDKCDAGDGGNGDVGDGDVSNGDVSGRDVVDSSGNVNNGDIGDRDVLKYCLSPPHNVNEKLYKKGARTRTENTSAYTGQIYPTSSLGSCYCNLFLNLSLKLGINTVYYNIQHRLWF